MGRLALVSLVIGALGAGCGSAEPQDSGKVWKLGEEVPDTGGADMGVDMPPGQDMAPDLPPVQLKVTGDACADNTECQGGICLKGEVWPQGYCSQGNACDAASCGAQGGRCETTGDNFTRCVLPCDAGGVACRSGYTCRTDGDRMSGTACLYDAPRPAGASDGEACQRDADCAGGTCITEQEGWSGGYCTTAGCSSREDCASYEGQDNRCLRQSRPSICVRMCQSNDDCREGYACEPVGQGQGICFPDQSVPFTEDLTAYPFTITCVTPRGEDVAYDFEVPEGATSVMTVPFVRDSGQLLPSLLTQPGQTISFERGAHAFQSTPARVFDGKVNPLVIPPTPNLSASLVSGAQTLNLLTNSEDVCHYTLSETTPGVTIDLNIYLVGVRGITAASAPNNQDITEMLAAFDAVYASAGVSIGKVRFFELSEEQTQAYQIIYDDAQIGQLLATSQRPGDTYDDVLSLNVYFVREMRRGGAIGVSYGLPGPAGLHGTGNSGVVFTAQFLGSQFQEADGTVADGNEYTGNTMAHEVGHYLGLFHTTEQTQRDFDPLDDTPRCTSNFPDGCPDLTNLMFPLASSGQSELSAGQSFVIQVNPLTKD